MNNTREMRRTLYELHNGPIQGWRRDGVEPFVPGVNLAEYIAQHSYVDRISDILVIRDAHFLATGHFRFGRSWHAPTSCDRVFTRGVHKVRCVGCTFESRPTCAFGRAVLWLRRRIAKLQLW